MGVHDGHRSRVRARFRNEGLDSFAPHEVLELLLFYGRARGDTNALAHELIETFGSLKGVLEAGPENLMKVKGIGEESATLISMVVPMFRKYQEDVVRDMQIVDSLDAAEKYCVALSNGLRRERLYMVSLSASGRVIGRRALCEGDLNHVTVEPRVVVETALNHNAHGVLLCHNHPGGLLKPSRDDIATTRVLQTLLHKMGIILVDHCVACDGEVYSMVRHGDLLV